MARFWQRNRGPLDLEAELRAGRPEPRPEFVQALGRRVRTSGRRAYGLRIAFAGGLTAVMLAALAAVGGVSYAAGGVHHAWTKVVAPKKSGYTLIPSKSSAADQYGRKTKVCHKGKTIEVSENAVPAHRRHGDKIGPCGKGKPAKKGGGGVKGKKIGFAG